MTMAQYALILHCPCQSLKPWSLLGVGPCHMDSQVEQFCREHDIGLVAIGPEVPLVDGLADFLTAADFKCALSTNPSTRIPICVVLNLWQ